jgi:hypothetical protein
MTTALSAPLASLVALLGGDAGPPAALDEAGWDALVTHAVRHGVAPLAHARLRDVPTRWRPPADALRRLQACYLRTGLENMRLYARLGAMLRAFHAEGIDAIVLKGACLARLVYRDIALRSMGDADVLVRRHDVGRALHAMHRLGWRGAEAAGESGHGDAAVGTHGAHQLPTLALDGVLVELHRAIEDDGHPFAIDEAGLWQRARRVSLGSAPAMVLAPEDMLLHLCLHTAYGHGWLQFDSGLRPLCDIALFVRHHGEHFDWTVFVERARHWKAANCAWLALVLARELAAADIPPAVVPALAGRGAAAWMQELAIRLAVGDHYGELVRALPVLAPSWLDKRWRHLTRADRWRAHLLPGRDALAREYPSHRGAASVVPCYLAHWAELGRDGLRLRFGRRGPRLLANERARAALLRWLESAA